MITTLEMEIALADYFGIRQNLIVPNVSWGMGIHECDLFVLTQAGYGREVEIKISKSDLIKDKNKNHGHFSSKIKFLDFAIPDYLQEYIDEIPDRAGIIIVDSNKEWRRCKRIRKPVLNSRYKYTDGERLQLAKLGTMRIWGLKKTIASHKNEGF